jgi:hypothetical protein
LDSSFHEFFENDLFHRLEQDRLARQMIICMLALVRACAETARMSQKHSLTAKTLPRYGSHAPGMYTIIKLLFQVAREPQLAVVPSPSFAPLLPEAGRGREKPLGQLLLRYFR